MSRPAIPPDYRDAMLVLIRDYSNVLRLDELSALWRMHGRPALRVIERLHLQIIARTAIDRAGGVSNG